MDVQRYYAEAGSSFRRYSETRWPGGLDYIDRRMGSVVVPAIRILRDAFDAAGWPTVYLRLCGNGADRGDLHRFFRRFNEEAARAGFPDAYPLASDTWADVVPGLAPRPGDTTVDKTGFSGFGNPALDGELRRLGVRTLVMTGLATSQCVDTTARDASERGFVVIHVADAQADYDEDTHASALYASRGVCGGHVVSTGWLAGDLRTRVESLAADD